MKFNNFGKRHKSFAKAVESSKPKPVSIIKDRNKGVSIKSTQKKQYQSNVDIIGIIERLNNQLKSIAKAITEMYSSDDESVSSQKKE